ncbi:MAG: PKD domain-containing protein [Candidatus Absconditabacteria bacterium]|nr:PKD domain-containing protein [Candidatus Absconditabacteria bacterium]MDD3868565.1 PKD domain-containing protein [Candidatus Absconditabacteria bacterium]MDD4714129.1 PKD domain-containing protein [Candidatus Absconditabacteria bacterium]
MTLAQNIPSEYKPNDNIQSSRDQIQGHFVTLEASQKMGETIGTDIFKDLVKLFDVVFPNFPQEYTFKVTYQQCESIATQLSTSYKESIFQNFMTNCYRPLNQVLGQIASKYTVVANASRNPNSGSAPLTVTFDARASKDPSNDTIPNNNYYRYYRDEKGIDRTIGIGNVINHTFTEAGNYIVHLTVRSSNKYTKGILDGTTSLSVNIAPKAANIVVYANTRKMDANVSLKIGTQEAQKGVVFDGSTTLPTGGRKIQSHKREITNRDGFRYNREGYGNPGNINVPLNGNGEYIITLSTVDNENNTVKESFSLTVSDPVATIKQSPEQGTTSSSFSFDASSSYSLTSRLKLYTWEIFDSNGDKTDTFQGKNIKKQFIQPGNYLVRLTIEDELGQSNMDTKEVYVESSTPIPQFTITPTKKRAEPSEFYLDANSTSDIDVTNKFDSLEYKWEFSNPNATLITETTDNNKIITVQFNETGRHIVKLIATDMFGKSATIEKTIEVKSVLRPELTISPAANTRGRNISFSVTANKPIINYYRNFGDGDTRSNQENQMQHIYGKIGNYQTSVTVTDAEENSNTISLKAFIGESGFPVAAYRIRSTGTHFLQTTDTCEVEENEETTAYEAYYIDRYQNITIDPSISVNSKGTSQGLAFYFKPKYGEVYKQNTFSHRFNEVGCQYIDLTVDDPSIGKQSEERIWFKVVNALPTLKNLTISFPQYGNDTGIGFQENNVQNILDITADESSNLIIKVTAVGASDPDGEISYFRRYYYHKDNPNRILETRITPSNISYVFFTIPRIAGEYMFGVTLYDNDEGRQKSEDIIGNGPMIFIPNTARPDTPIVTLRSDKQVINVGDTVTFDVIAKATTENEDFFSNRTIYYDFDGDGEYDLITKDDRVSYTYNEANESGYLPKVKVEYRSFPGYAEGSTIIVKNGVKPVLTFNSIKNIVIFRDLSIGDIVQRNICFDANECALGNNKYRKLHIVPVTNTTVNLSNNDIVNNKVFVQEYPAFGNYKVSIDSKSLQGISVSGDYQVQTSNNESNGRITNGINLITIPETTLNNSNPEIYVSKSMDDSVLFYLHHEGEGQCYIDTDISVDSDRDGKTENDFDIPCNTPILRKYTPLTESIIGRVYFEYNGKLVFKNFNVSFEASEILLDETNKTLYTDITTLINGIEDTTIGNTDLKTLLDILRKNLLDKNQTSANVVGIQTHITETAILIDAEQKALLESIITRLSNADTVSALGGNEYEKAREAILTILPTGLSTLIREEFTQFENNSERLDEEGKRESLNAIITLIASKGPEYEFQANDMTTFIQPEFCKIFAFYDIASEACNTLLVPGDTTTPNTSGESSNNGGLPTWLKIILRIIFGGIIIIGGVIVFFAVKAKLREQEEDEEDESE